MNKIQIIPTILATSEEEYKEKFQAILQSRLFDGNWVQIDIMDNKFVQNRSVGVDVVSNYPANFKREAHLMVEYPENWIDDLIQIGINRIVLPLEDTEGMVERLEHIKNHQVEVGLSINPETPVAKVLPFMGKIDVILIMSVHPGFGGQPWLPETLLKVKELSQYKAENNFLIEVDGGINENNAQRLVEAGADNLIIGEHLIHGNITRHLEQIQESISL